jgi:hypothetical protein
VSRLLNPRRFNAEKFAWQHQVLEDPELSAFSRVLGAFLTHYLDPEKGGSWASQQFLATRLGVDVRTIRRATSELVAQGHLALEVSRGRGNANLCRALLEVGKGPEAAAGCEHATAQRRVSGQPPAAEHRTGLSGDRPESRTITGRKPDIPARPILSEPESPLVPPMRFEQSQPAIAALSQRKRRPGSHRAPAKRTYTSRFPHDDIRAAIVRAIGEAGTQSYLDPAAWCPAERTIVCRLSLAAEALQARAAKELAELGVVVSFNVSTHARLRSSVGPHSACDRLTASCRVERTATLGAEIGRLNTRDLLPSNERKSLLRPLEI